MVAHVPAWVFAVFALLLALGIWLSRPRAVSPIVPVVMAVVFPVYSLYGLVGAFGVTVVSILSWAAALLMSVLLGKRVFGPANLARVPGTSKVRIPGSWMPLGLMMGIFVAKFAVGFVQGAHLPVGQRVWFAPTMCIVLGALSGGFASRAIAIRRFLGAATSDA
jgi:hypothetical protein